MPTRLRTGLTPSRPVCRVPLMRSLRAPSHREHGQKRHAGGTLGTAFPAVHESQYLESRGGDSPRPFPDPGRIAS